MVLDLMSFSESFSIAGGYLFVVLGVVGVVVGYLLLRKYPDNSGVFFAVATFGLGLGVVILFKGVEESRYVSSIDLANQIVNESKTVYGVEMSNETAFDLESASREILVSKNSSIVSNLIPFEDVSKNNLVLQVDKNGDATIFKNEGEKLVELVPLLTFV